MVITGTPSAPPGSEHFAPAPPSTADAGPATQALIKEARRRHRRRLAAISVGLLVLALVAGLGVGVLSRHAGRTPSPRAGTPSQTGVFSRPTDDVLLFADGLGLDLDHRVAGRQPIAGQHSGDQRWDIVRAGNAVVVGWGEVWATAIASGTARRLGPVVTFVPAAEPKAVWLIDYPGGRIGEGTPTLREVTTTGRTLHLQLGPPPSEGVPAVGIPGGLAFETDSGVALWNVAAHRFTRRLGTGPGYVGDAAGDTLAWCQSDCTTLQLTDLSTRQGRDRAFSSSRIGGYFESSSLRLSPDGRYAAVLVTRSGLGTAGQMATLELLDHRTGRTSVVRRGVSAWSTMAWSTDGRTLFFASDTGLGYGRTRSAETAPTGTGMTLGQFQPLTGRTATAHVPMTNAEQFVVLERSQAGSFLSSIHRTRTCSSIAITPGVPSPPCGSVSF
ncbi:MAG TPA: hypothetical protein VNC61_13940 [Acidimicrobiales bacterium]|nr:hypothetical protein [Acidimicrobiales bacterium]